MKQFFYELIEQKPSWEVCRVNEGGEPDFYDVQSRLNELKQDMENETPDQSFKRIYEGSVMAAVKEYNKRWVTEPIDKVKYNLDVNSRVLTLTSCNNNSYMDLVTGEIYVFEWPDNAKKKITLPQFGIQFKQDNALANNNWLMSGMRNADDNENQQSLFKLIRIMHSINLLISNPWDIQEAVKNNIRAPFEYSDDWYLFFKDWKMPNGIRIVYSLFSSSKLKELLGGDYGQSYVDFLNKQFEARYKK